MKTICFRLLTFILLAAGLSFVSEANLRVEDGKIFLVGRCQHNSSFSGPLVAVARAEKEVDLNGKKVFKVSEIYTVSPDKEGFFLLKNLPADSTYFFLGAQFEKSKPVEINTLNYVDADHYKNRVINLGNYEVSAKKAGDQEVAYTISRARELKIDEIMQHFVAKNALTKFAHHVCNKAGYYGVGNPVLTQEMGKIILSGIAEADWKNLSL